MSIIDTLITNRTAADVSAGTAKGHYNASDLNRVGEAVRYVAGLLNGYGYAVAVTGRTDWAMGDIPSQTDMNVYRADLVTLRGAVAVMSTTPEVPGSMSGLDWSRANNMEKILQDVDELITKMAAAWFYCGEIYAGEV